MPKADKFSCVFDTSAVIAYLADEPGAAKVATLKPQAAVPFMVCSELYYLVWRSKGKAEADNAYALVKSWELPLLMPNERIILTAGRLKAVHGLGIADSFIASCAIVHGVPLVSKDPDYEVLEPDLRLLKFAPA